MTVVVLCAISLVAGGIDGAVMALATGERVRAFKTISPVMLTPLAVVFGLLVGFLAAQVWNDAERANGGDPRGDRAAHHRPARVAASRRASRSHPGARPPSHPGGGQPGMAGHGQAGSDADDDSGRRYRGARSHTFGRPPGG